jgi:hypothetical protein
MSKMVAVPIYPLFIRPYLSVPIYPRGKEHQDYQELCPPYFSWQFPLAPKMSAMKALTTRVYFLVKHHLRFDNVPIILGGDFNA